MYLIIDLLNLFVESHDEKRNICWLMCGEIGVNCVTEQAT